MRAPNEIEESAVLIGIAIVVLYFFFKDWLPKAVDATDTAAKEAIGNGVNVVFGDGKPTSPNENYISGQVAIDAIANDIGIF